MLPEGWKRLRVGDLISRVDAGVSVNGEDRLAEDGEAGVLKVSCVSSGVFLPNQHKAISEQELARAKISPKADRVIVSRSNTEMLVGASAYVPEDFPNLYLSDKLWQLEPKNADVVCMQWLAYWLASDSTREALAKLGTGTSGSMKNISKEELLGLTIPTPSVAEQSAIANVIDTWDMALVNAEKILANSRKQKQALMQMLLFGRLRPDGQTKTLHRCHASEIFTTTSVRRKAGLNLLSVTQEFGVVPRHLLDRKVVMPEGSTDAYKLVEPGDFIISLRSFEGGLEYSRYQGLVSPAYTVLRARQTICDDFYRHYFKSDDFISRLAVAVIGIRDGKQISYEDFAFLKLPCPTLDEQIAISRVLNNAESEIARLTSQVEALKTEKRALMADLLTGKRRIGPSHSTEKAAA